MRRLAKHALIHDGDLEAPRRWTGDEAQLGKLSLGVLHKAKIHRGVAHGSAETAVNQARPWRGPKVSRQQAAARCLEAKEAAMRSRYANRASAVRPVGERQDTRGDASRRATARSARTVVEVPWIARRPIEHVLSAVDQTHLRHVGDADEDEAGALGRGEEGCSLVRNVV